MSTVNSAPGLLAIARRVLIQHDFRVSERILDGADAATWLLAESEYFLLALAAGESFDDLLVLEGFLAASLATVFEDGKLGPKRWDSYVVLLSSSGADQRGTPDVVRLQYNTRSLRRLVSLGIPAHEDTVAEALATFLPLPESLPGGLRSAFDELVAQLVINGIAEDQAATVVSSYRTTGSIDGP
jgi:hypothetical protein